MPNLATRTLDVDPVTLSFLQWLFEQEQDKQTAIRGFREYYDGQHDTQLTDRQAEYLQLKDGDQEFNANYCPTVVDSLVERLKVTGFKAEAEGLAAQLWAWWDASNLDTQQGIVHTAAVRDGEAFLMVSYDQAAGRPVFTFEPYCVDGVGCKVHYSQEKRGAVSFASKRWIVEEIVKPGEEPQVTRRLNLYFPDRIEKYWSRPDYQEGIWLKYVTEAEPQWPIPWVDRAGQPLGVPVFHFKNRDQGDDAGVSDLRDVVPLQNAINKSIIDLLAAADTGAFGILWATGTDASALDIGPGAMLHASDDTARFGRLPGEDLTRMIELKDSFAVEVARVSRTPLGNFQISRQRAAEGTLKQEEAGLVARAERCQAGFGPAWAGAMQMAVRLHNLYGNGEARLAEDPGVETIWADAQVRNEKEFLEELALKRNLGVPLEFLWAEAGYSADQIAAMKATEEYQAVRAGQQVAVSDALLLQEAANG